MKFTRLLFVVAVLLTALTWSVYGQVPLSDNMPASGILGYTSFTSPPKVVDTAANHMDMPKGIAVDPTTGKLFVADYNNRRVLRWSSAAKMINGSAAEAVLGQPDFTSVSSGTSSTKMSRPYGICVDGSGRLWVADLSNNRVLRFDNASTIASGSPANRVLGQADFATGSVNTGGISASTMSAPIGVFVDGAGRLWVGERDNKRVLRFDNAASKSNGDPADGVLGEPNFTTNSGGLSASLMTRAYGVFVDGSGRLWVGDRDNNRVLRFDNAATKANGAAADGVLGQVDFVTAVAARTQPGMEGPRGVFGDAMGKLYVNDEANNRILVYNNAATKANGTKADNVLGQVDFTSYVIPNPPTGSSLNYPEFTWYDNANYQLWIADEYNFRVLRFDMGAPLPFQSFNITDWGFVGGGRINNWTFTPGTAAGSATISGTAPNYRWTSIRGGFVDAVQPPVGKALVVTGKMEFVGGAFTSPGSLRFGLFYSENAGTIVKTNVDSTRWSGTETYTSGYLFIPPSGTNGLATWSGLNQQGSAGAVVNGAWLQNDYPAAGPGRLTYSYILGQTLQTPANAAGGAGVYNFVLSVAPRANGTSKVTVSLANSGKTYSFAGQYIDAASPRATDKFNSVNFTLDGGTTTTSIKFTEVKVDQLDTAAVPVGKMTGVEDVAGATPTEFALLQNYPNPFNPSTTIRFSLPVASHVTLRVFNMLGQEVATLLDEVRGAGNLQTVWNGKSLSGNAVASGMYVYRIDATSVSGDKRFVSACKMLLLK